MSSTAISLPPTPPVASVKTVVLEVGEAFLRAGLSGDAQPRTEVCLLEGSGGEPLSSTSPSIYSSDSCGGGGGSSLFNPDVRPCALFHEKICALFSSLFIEQMLLKPRDYRILVVEHIFLNANIRNAIANSLLAFFQFISVSFQPGLVLPPLLLGASDSIIVDIGFRESRVLAMVDYRPLIASLRFASVGVASAKAVFLNLLNMNSGSSSSSSSANKIFEKLSGIHDIDAFKESEAHYSSSLLGKEKDKDIDHVQSYKVSLMTIVAGIDESTCSILDDFGGLVGAICLALQHVPVDNRLSAASNLILCGGGADLNALRPLLLAEMHRQLSEYKAKSERVKRASGRHFGGSGGSGETPDSNRARQLDLLVNSKENSLPLKSISSHTIHPSLLSWVGGSVFACIKSNDRMFLTAHDMRTGVGVGTGIAVLGSGNSGRAGGAGKLDLVVPDWLVLFDNNTNTSQKSSSTLSEDSKSVNSLTNVYRAFFSPNIYRHRANNICEAQNRIGIPVGGENSSKELSSMTTKNYIGTSHRGSATFSSSNYKSSSSALGGLEYKSGGGASGSADNDSNNNNSNNSSSRLGGLTSALDLKSLLSALPSQQVVSKSTQSLASLSNSKIQVASSMYTVAGSSSSSNSNKSSSLLSSSTANPAVQTISNSLLRTSSSSGSSSATMDNVNNILKSLEDAKRKK